jgi:hypothetical protein
MASELHQHLHGVAVVVAVITIALILIITSSSMNEGHACNYGLTSRWKLD